uniref:protein xylosyltransferase n=1 Tax=Meloidogyne javanica TaxID=6303 RepID=A0A915LVD5_MELJA
MLLLSLEELEKQLENSSNKSFLSSHGYNTASFLHKQGFNFHFLECEKRMWRVAKRSDFPLNLRLDGGSDWLIIHRDLAKYSVSNEDLPSNLRLLFTTILLPLESFFHTLSINSKKFCNQIFNQNLRFTNWERKQGCRCSAFKPIVDWCGCSPLAVKNIEVEKKINLKRCQEKNLFFGRKFDSFIDIEPINFLQKQFLIEQITSQQNKKDFQIITEEGIFELIGGIEFGIGFDVKEEIFRIYPPIVDLNLNNLFTLKWKWNLILNNGNNWTSPNVNLILNGPNNEFLFNGKIKSYDSLNGIQFVDIKLKNILNENPNVNSGNF